MDAEGIRKAYRRYALGYDLCFGAVLQPGRRAIIERLRCNGSDRVLEVGVGTGLSLPLYPRDVQVTGIDISPEMLARARARQRRHALDQVELREMDAEQMSFEDDRFDKVVAMYVASVVPSPVRLVAEMRRVCRPDGELFFVNHFLSANPLGSALEQLLAPLSAVLGFRPDLRLEPFVTESGLEVADRGTVNLLGCWTYLRTINRK